MVAATLNCRASVSNFGDWLREERDRRGWDQPDVATRADTSIPTISRLETGARSPSRKLAIRIAEALGADPREALEALMADTPGLEPVVEMTGVPDEEYLQEGIMGYSGPNPILSAAAATARSMQQLFDNAGPALTGGEPREELARGRGPRKGITKTD